VAAEELRERFEGVPGDGLAVVDCDVAERFDWVALAGTRRVVVELLMLWTRCRSGCVSWTPRGGLRDREVEVLGGQRIVMRPP
jgi:hypothetical protein